MLRFKVESPTLPACIDRPRLIGAVAKTPVVALVAPTGYGKTCFAAEIAAATGGPAAWFTADEFDRDRAGVVTHVLAAMARGWPDLGAANAPIPDDAAAVPVLGATLETIAGPGCLVLDDVHLLAPDVLDAVLRVTIAALPPDVRLVVATRTSVGGRLLHEVAAGRATMLGAASLAFDESECARAGATVDPDTYLRTGGWPLAVGLSLRAIRPGPIGANRVGQEHFVDDPSALADVALVGLHPGARSLLAVTARIPRCPRRLLAATVTDSVALDAFVRTNPALFHGDDDWWSPREWLREELRRRPVGPSIVDAVAAALIERDETELAACLFVAEARFADARPLIECLSSDGLRLGRAAWVRSLIAQVPNSARTFELELLAVAAAQALSIVDPTVRDRATESDLCLLVERAAGQSDGALLRARALLASHHRMTGDARLLAVCEQALGDAITGDLPEVVDDHWPVPARCSPDVGWAAAELVRFYGQALVFARERTSIARGRRLVELALDLLDRAGRPTASQRSWWAYTEVLLHLRPADEAVRAVRLAAHRLAELGHSDAAVRFAELATLEFFLGDRTGARRSIEHAREFAHRTGNGIALPALDAIEVGLDVGDEGFTAGHADRFDEICARIAADPRLAPFESLVTAELGVVLARQGHLGAARRYHIRAEAALGATLSTHTTSLRCRRVRGLILLAEGDIGGGLGAMSALRRDAAREGRDALVATIDLDLAALDGEDRHDGRSSPTTPPIEVCVLGPEVTVVVDGAATSPPRGYPAKLLALLVAADGLMTIDAAIEGLWPGADPVVGRNRLHGVILRLRRGLGLPASGPIGCLDGIVRLQRSDLLRIDSWEFERLAAGARCRPDERPAAIAAYSGDVLSVQFAYDDTIEAYRRALRRMFVQLSHSAPADRRDHGELELPEAVAFPESSQATA